MLVTSVKYNHQIHFAQKNEVEGKVYIEKICAE